MDKKKKNSRKRSPFEEKRKGEFITIKTSLKRVLRNYEVNFPLVNNLVLECNKIIITAYQFIKLYILHCYHNDKEIPELTEEVLSCFIRAIGIKENKGKGVTKFKEFQEELNTFYKIEFQPCINEEKINLVNKKYVLAYLITQIHTSFYNNIKEHFITRFRRFVNLSFPTPLYDKNRRKIKENLKIANEVKNLILLNKIHEIKPEFQEYACTIKDSFLPELEFENYGYDVKVNPHKYLAFTIKMNDYLEKANEGVDRFKKNKLFHALPLRTQIVPKYITLDAMCILNLLSIGTSNYTRQYPLKQEENLYRTWNKLFLMKKRVMRMNNYIIKTIQTDGVGVSLVFQKKGRKYGSKSKEEETEEMYIEDLNKEELELCKTMKLVSVDPGKDNIVYMIDEENIKLRYTAPQRRKESYNKKYSKIVEYKKIKASIIEKETELSDYNSKTVNYQKFKEYIFAKTSLNNSVKDFYTEIKLRKFKWRTWIYGRKSEDKFLNRIKDTYGENILIGYGDWSLDKQMKYIKPTKGIGFRRTISKKFKTILVDEYRTSKLCNRCLNELSNSVDKNNKKIHRVLICTGCRSNSSESKRFTFINRDINACVNILSIIKSWIQSQERPHEFKRTTRSFT